MRNREAYTRYKLIDARLRKKPHPTLEELRYYLEDHLGKSISIRTINYDLANMRFDQALGFCAPIIYDKAERGYRYSDANYSIMNLPQFAEAGEGLDFAMKVLQQLRHIPETVEAEEAIRKVAERVEEGDCSSISKVQESQP